MHLPYSSWDRPVPKEGGWGSREVWRDLAKSAQRLQHQPEGEVRRGLEKRDQEIAKAERSGALKTIGIPIPCLNNFSQLDQNMARLWRNQGQVHPDGESQVDRNGSLKKINFVGVPVFIRFLSAANGALQDCRTRDENQSLQQRGIDMWMEMCIIFWL